jgi:hypothetical protein
MVSLHALDFSGATAHSAIACVWPLHLHNESPIHLVERTDARAYDVVGVATARSDPACDLALHQRANARACGRSAHLQSMCYVGRSMSLTRLCYV